MPHIIQKDDSTYARSMLTHTCIPGRILRPRPPSEGRAGDARATRFAPETARSARPEVKTAPHSALHCQASAFQRFSLSYQWSVHSPGGTASHGNMTFCWTDPFTGGLEGAGVFVPQRMDSGGGLVSIVTLARNGLKPAGWRLFICDRASRWSDRFIYSRRAQNVQPQKEIPAMS